jgi:hypothetical protein
MFQVTDDAVRLLSNSSEFDTWLNKLIPPTPEFDVFKLASKLFPVF